MFADPRFWRLAPLSAACIGTAWSLQGLWAAQWFTDVERLDRARLVDQLFTMAAACLGALLLGVVADRLRRRGVGPEALLGMVATAFIAAQPALILRWSVPSTILWAIVAAVGAATVVSYAVLSEYFPKELSGRANGALNLFHIGGAFVVQYLTGAVLVCGRLNRGTIPRLPIRRPSRSASPFKSQRGCGLRSNEFRFVPKVVRRQHGKPLSLEF